MSKKSKKSTFVEEPAKKSIFGIFRDPAYISHDDPYEKDEAISSRYLGSNFKVGTLKKGQVPSVYFGKKYLSLAATDQGPTLKGGPEVYQDPAKAARVAAKAAKLKNIDKDKDFRYTGAIKQSTGPGSYYGTFQGKPFEHQADYEVEKKGEPPKHKPVPQPPNIKTRPAKKGTYGFIGTTFMKMVTAPKEGTADVYNKLHLDEVEHWKKSKLLIEKISKATFKGTCRGMSTLDEKNSRGVSSVYDAYVPPEDKKKKKKKTPKPKKGEKPPLELPPFKHASGKKSGEAGYFSKFPKATLDADKDGAEGGDKKKSKKGKDKKAKEEPKPLGGAWKPVSGPKSSVIKSLLRRFY